MNKKVLTRILYVTIILAIIGVFILNFLDYNIFTKKGVFKLPLLISAIVLFWGGYLSWGWKWPILKRIVYKENFNGTWFGTYNSKNYTSNAEFKGEIALIIRQTFLTLNIKSYTTNYINHSFGEVLNYEKNSDTHQLIYLYCQSEFKPSDDNKRKGASELELHCNKKKKELFGDFWTNHNSKGNLNLTKISKKHSKSFEEATQYLKNNI